MDQTKQRESEVTAELRRIAEERGGLLRPEEVVEHARDPESPLHNWFEWDDDAAAEKYRIHQARNLIRVNVAYLQTTGKSIPYRVFVSLSPNRSSGSGYSVTMDVLNNPEQRAVMMADALRELRGWQLRYRGLKELEVVFDAINKVEMAS
jgi:hypothetical protein